MAFEKEKAHSEFSASGSHRWLACPGSIKLSREVPPSPDTKYAKEGTKAHTLFEKWVLHHVNSPHFTFAIPKGFPRPMVDAVKVSIEEVKKLLKRMGSVVVEAERKVSLAHIYPSMFGTLDLRILEHYGTLYIRDYKNGFHVVEVQGKDRQFNPQLMYYALASAHEFDYDFDKVDIGILQPRAFHHEGAHRSRALRMEELRKFEDTLKRGVERALAKRPKFQAGEWCGFCPAKGICVAHQRFSGTNAAKAFSHLLLEES